MNALSPLATLERGYSICYDGSGAVVRDAGAVDVGDPLRVRLHRGTLEGAVTGRVTTSDEGQDR